MSRRVFFASLFHLSPFSIEWIIREDMYRSGSAWIPYRGGLLAHCDPHDGHLLEFPREARLVRDCSPAETTHLLFIADGPVLSLPTFDRQEVLSTVRNPPFSKNCDDTDSAREGYEKLWDIADFDRTPHWFGQAALLTAVLLNELGDELDSELDDEGGLQTILDRAYNLARGVEHVKLETDLDWSQCDLEFAKLGAAVDRIITAHGRIYSRELSYRENILLATRARIFRCLRVSDDWRRPFHYRELADAAARCSTL